MPRASRFPNLTANDVLALFAELGSRKHVAERLGYSVSGLNKLLKRLGIDKHPATYASQNRSCLDPFHDQIAELAAQGCTCPEIVDELDLPVQPEQVRRFMHSRGIELLARPGAQPGEKHRDWKGGRIEGKSGYILVRQPDHPNANSSGYVREHRLVMERKLGRYLAREEVVHHINGDRSDNRPENLEVFGSNGEHLAETLKGQRPNWSEDGKRRIVQAVRKPRTRKRRARANGQHRS